MGRKKIPEDQLKQMIVIGVEKIVIDKVGGVDKVIEIAKKAIYKTK